MLQKLYELLLYHFVDNIRIYDFLVQAFPKCEQNFIDRVEKKIAEVHIPEDTIKQMQVETWERICEQLKEKCGKAVI